MRYTITPIFSPLIRSGSATLRWNVAEVSIALRYEPMASSSDTVPCKSPPCSIRKVVYGPGEIASTSNRRGAVQGAG